MNRKEFKEAFLTALRSGEYKQGRNALCKVDALGKHPQFCCIGVALNTINPKGWNKPGFGGREQVLFYDLEADNMPPDLQLEYGFFQQATKPIRNWPDRERTIHQTMIELNDGSRWSFQQIADWFEKEYVV